MVRGERVITDPPTYVETPDAPCNVAERDSGLVRPWHRWYEPGVPETIRVPDLSLPSLLAGAVARHPDRAAIRYFGRVISYRELDQAVARFANALRNLGVERGDRVALLLPNCPQMVIAYYGGLRAGAVLVPTSPLAAQGELRQQWGEAGVRTVVTLSLFYPAVRDILEALPSLEHVVVTNIKEYLPSIKRLLFTAAKERREGHHVRFLEDGRTHWLQPLLAAAPEFDQQVSVDADDLALLQGTGGTTGTPKMAMLTHRMLLANALQIRAWLGNLAKPDGSDVILGVVPLFHIYGMSTVLNLSILAGGTMILQPRFAVKDVLRALDREKPDFFPGVPTMYMAINNAPRVHRYDLRSVKAAISGAAPLPRTVQTRFEELTDATLVEGYGLTEASPVTHCNPLTRKRKIGSIGVPLPGTDAAIFDAETSTRLLAPGELGELAVRGPQVMLGYWRNPGETAQVLKDGWLFTGDLATVDEDGFFAIVDRKKDLIISGGMNVYPRDVEETLYAHPKVRKAVAVGIPEEKWGEAVKVYVVLKEGETATAEEITAYCRRRMARYKVPKYVEFRSALPENLVGKVLRRVLLEEEEAQPHSQDTSRDPQPHDQQPRQPERRHDSRHSQDQELDLERQVEPAHDESNAHHEGRLQDEGAVGRARKIVDGSRLPVEVAPEEIQDPQRSGHRQDPLDAVQCQSLPVPAPLEYIHLAGHASADQPKHRDRDGGGQSNEPAPSPRPVRQGAEPTPLCAYGAEPEHDDVLRPLPQVKVEDLPGIERQDQAHRE